MKARTGLVLVAALLAGCGGGAAPHPAPGDGSSAPGAGPSPAASLAPSASPVPAAGAALPSAGSAPTRTRVLVVGFDGLSWDVIRPWLDEGRMPHLKRLIEAGTSAPLRTIFPPSSPPAWTSAITGVNPGKHGVFGFVRPLAATGEAAAGGGVVTALDREYVALWTLLSRAGRRVGVINVPVTTPPDPVNGFMIGGFPHPSGVPVAVPPDLLAGFPDYRLDVFGDRPAGGNEERWLRHLYAVEDARADLARRQLEAGGYDLFFVVFTATDRIQHFFWKHMDARHPGHDPALAPRFGHAIRDLHAHLDARLGELVAAAGPGAITMVLSDHGFGPAYHGIAAEPLLRALNPDYRPGEVPKCYLFSHFGGQLYVSLRGRERFGTVAPGAEYEARKELLAGVLRGLVDPARGVPLVGEIRRREEVYAGDRLEHAPDLLFLESDGYLVMRFPSDDLVADLPPDYFSGFHRMDGVLAVAGPGIQRGRRLESARLLDVAPTLLQLLGEPVPTYMDGRPIAGALVDPAPPRTVDLAAADYREASRRPVTAAGAGSAAAAGDMEEQLRSLGYLQ